MELAEWHDQTSQQPAAGTTDENDEYGEICFSAQTDPAPAPFVVPRKQKDAGLSCDLKRESSRPPNPVQHRTVLTIFDSPKLCLSITNGESSRG